MWELWLFESIISFCITCLRPNWSLDLYLLLKTILNHKKIYSRWTKKHLILSKWTTQSFFCSELEFLLWIGYRYNERGSQIETMAKANLLLWRLSWRKIHSCGDHGEGSSIVVDTENLNCPRPSPRANELSQILKMVSQTLIFLIPVKKI